MTATKHPLTSRPERVNLPSAEEKWGHILEMFELGDGPIGTGQRHCVWFHALKAGGYRWRCSCGVESRHASVSAALFAEARTHFEQPWQPPAVPIGTPFAIWNDRANGQPPPTIGDLELLAQEFAEEDADVTPLRPHHVETEIIHRCGICGETFQIDRKDPHWATGQGPICPKQGDRDMNRINEIFGTAPVLLPVIHPISRQEAIAAVRVAHEHRVKGIFLIDQGMSERDVLALVREIREQYPALWIGINLLSRSPAETLAAALDVCGAIDGIWTDNAGIDDRVVHQRADTFVAARRSAGWTGLYFGGVAFKYQREIATEHLGRAAISAAPYMDVVCTSGPGTGYAADVEKVRALRAGLGDDHAMALASGVTPQNVRSYMPYVQAFLVGTGIESRLGVLDPAKIEALQEAME